jgi:bifunctional non-homologous end joining protein LigD
MAKSSVDPLGRYRAKRSAESTPEPFSSGVGRPLLFVIHKHAARRTHYDLRLEWGGTLKSWAVPKGPSLDPSQKRLAVEVEDHPVEYADFEGLIPAGNYGVGAIIVWDQGRWVPVEDPHEGWRRGKLLFELHGYKLRGLFTLVRTKSHPKEWLLIKKPDRGSPRDDASLPTVSIFSGLTVEELRDAPKKMEALLSDAAHQVGARPSPAPLIDEAQPMLAETADRPFSKKGWLFEIKYDGFRLFAARQKGEACLRFRGGGDASTAFPELTRALARWPADVLVDGELVVLDHEGRPNFQALQRRFQLSRATDVARATIEHPVTLFVFDLLALGNLDLRALPLLERRRLIELLVPSIGPVRLSPVFFTEGERLFEEVRRVGLEGIVAKRATSPYRAGRSGDWLKIRIDRTADFVIVGFTTPRGSRAGLGALHLAAFDDEELVYVGKVGSGLSGVELRALEEKLSTTGRPTPPCRGETPHGRDQHWVTPELVCEVRYHLLTEQGLLRQSAFLRLRSDKRPKECVLPHPRKEGSSELPLSEIAPSPKPRTLKLSHVEKVFFPQLGYTKRDLIDYYRTIAPFLLPYLRNRPLVLTRYPDGLTGKSFYQKDAPRFTPDWVRTERIYSEHAAREIDYFVCDDLDTLLYLVNSGTIPLHVWASRVGTLERPDWCIVDLDPKGAPLSHVLEVARALLALCRAIELPCHPKTSGQSGLHLLIPLGRFFTYEQSRTFGQLLCRVVEEKLPSIATTTRALDARGGKVYLDYLQNRHGQLLVAPYSVRPTPEATVSTPLTSREVRARLDPKRFTIASVPERVAGRGDPMRSLLEESVDLLRALDRLLELHHRAGKPRRP